MGNIERNTKRAEEREYDLIIIGGGIHGAMLALEATRYNLCPLLIEKDDFGGSTSYNSLRIIHGGFRYFQQLDLRRLLESAYERQWFLKTFPEYVKPLACLMPLYGNGLHRSSILGLALSTYNVLTYRRNSQVRSDRHIPSGKILSTSETLQACPHINPNGLKGGAVWYDAYMENSQPIIMGLLRWANEFGATTLNYVEGKNLIKSNGKVRGVEALDHISGQHYTYHSSIVVNAAGPWCRELAQHFDRDNPDLFRSMIAWNILFSKKMLSQFAIAVNPNRTQGQTYFIVPWKGLLMAGTGHAPWHLKERRPYLSADQIRLFCHDLNAALPGIDLAEKDILHTFPGLQSAKQSGGTQFATRDIIFNHGRSGGPKGLYSISGIKFTTSRRFAAKALKAIYLNKVNNALRPNRIWNPPKDSFKDNRIFDFEWTPKNYDNSWVENLMPLIKEEAVEHLDDLIFRRTNIGDNGNRARQIAPLLCKLFYWDEKRCESEIGRVQSQLYMTNEFIY